MIRKKHMLAMMRVSEEKEPVAKEGPITTVPKEVVSVPKPSRKELYAGIIVALIIGLAVGYATNYASQAREYQGALKVPYTTIQEGDVVWAFRTLDETIQKWSLPIDTYTYYVDKAKPLEYHHLTTDGDSFTMRKMELFVQPELFSNVIHDLTDGNTAKDFVQEVFNLRVQMTLYSDDITDTPQWPAETMTEGTGDCEDFAILMGSLLVAGNEQTNYGMTVQMVYMDTDNPANPQTVNHILLYIIYEDETVEFVDSTSTDVLSPWSRVVGWYYDL
ncbi:hypothetical protein E3J74_02655 [Candidatus Bathyarchaeota archaeon]|nr:MAG: hypothetical protein E3J74_02655 [Candidatus Bathyarchaeota archaeon]